MTETPIVQLAQEFVIEFLISYVVFALASAAAGLWINAPRLHDRYRAYGLASVMAAAIVLLVIYTPITLWHASVALGITAVRTYSGANAP